MAFTSDYAPISHKPENLPGRKPRRKLISEGMATGMTQKPVRQQDISTQKDPMGANAKRSSKGGVRGNGMTVGLRF